jgi:hypothetical protein
MLLRLGEEKQRRKKKEERGKKMKKGKGSKKVSDNCQSVN